VPEGDRVEKEGKKQNSHLSRAWGDPFFKKKRGGSDLEDMGIRGRATHHERKKILGM